MLTPKIFKQHIQTSKLCKHICVIGSLTSNIFKQSYYARSAQHSNQGAPGRMFRGRDPWRGNVREFRWVKGVSCFVCLQKTNALIIYISSLKLVICAIICLTSAYCCWNQLEIRWWIDENGNLKYEHHNIAAGTSTTYDTLRHLATFCQDSMGREVVSPSAQVFVCFCTVQLGIHFYQMLFEGSNNAEISLSQTKNIKEKLQILINAGFTERL